MSDLIMQSFITDLRYIYDRIERIQSLGLGMINELSVANMKIAKVAIRVALVEIQKQQNV